MSLFRSKWFKLFLILVAACTWLFWPTSFELIPGCLKVISWQDRPAILGHYVLSNLGIFVPYMIMPVTLLSYVWIRRKEIPASWFWIVTGIGTFVMSCGLTHLVHAITAYHPWFWFEVKINWLTSAVSFLVAWYLLFPFRPVALGWGKELLEERNAAEQRAMEFQLLNVALTEEKTKAETQAKVLEETNHRLEVTRDEARAQAEELHKKGVELVEALNKIEAANQELAKAKASVEGQRDEARQALQLRDAQDEVGRLRQTVQQLQTPILEAWEGILLCSIQGVLDSSRAQSLMEAALASVEGLRARVLVLDLTAVEMVDTHVADRLDKLTRAVKMLGGRCVVCGIQKDVAMTMAHAGIRLDTDTFPSLKEALQASVR